MESNQVNSQISSIQRTLAQKGGVYSNYRCKNVSWDDVSRFGAGKGASGLSCSGSNITDTRLYSKNGSLLYTVRPENWNEKLGTVSANDISLIHNNTPITLTDYITNFSTNAKYALKGNNNTNLYSNNTDDKVSVRFQTTFLPVEDTRHGNIELAPEVYTYGNNNINLLSTSQGTSVQQGTSGKNKLFHHEVDSNGTIHRYWFEAERSKHSVGTQHTETEEEVKEALDRGKSIATCIGLKSMGTRFNVLMTIQVPVKNNRPRRMSTFNSNFFQPMNGYGGGRRSHCDGAPAGDSRGGGGGSASATVYIPLDRTKNPHGIHIGDVGREATKSVCSDEEDYEILRSSKATPRVSAGRLSRGSEHDTWDGIKNTDIKRDHNQHITVTIVLYNTVAGGVPNEEDVTKAIDDMENLYNSCQWSGKLADSGAQYTTSVPQNYLPTARSYNSLLTKFPTSTNKREIATDCKA